MLLYIDVIRFLHIWPLSFSWCPCELVIQLLWRLSWINYLPELFLICANWKSSFGTERTLRNKQSRGRKKKRPCSELPIITFFTVECKMRPLIWSDSVCISSSARTRALWDPNVYRNIHYVCFACTFCRATGLSVHAEGTSLSMPVYRSAFRVGHQFLLSYLKEASRLRTGTQTQHTYLQRL